VDLVVSWSVRARVCSSLQIRLILPGLRLGEIDHTLLVVVVWYGWFGILDVPFLLCITCGSGLQLACQIPSKNSSHCCLESIAHIFILRWCVGVVVPLAGMIASVRMDRASSVSWRRRKRETEEVEIGNFSFLFFRLERIQLQLLAYSHTIHARKS